MVIHSYHHSHHHSHHHVNGSGDAAQAAADEAAASEAFSPLSDTQSVASGAASVSVSSGVGKKLHERKQRIRFHDAKEGSETEKPQPSPTHLATLFPVGALIDYVTGCSRGAVAVAVAEEEAAEAAAEAAAAGASRGKATAGRIVVTAGVRVTEPEEDVDDVCSGRTSVETVSVYHRPTGGAGTRKAEGAAPAAAAPAVV